MIVYAAADFHGQLPAVPEDAELLLIAGDVCPDFRGADGARLDKQGFMQSRWLDTVFRDWLSPISVPVVSIWGNHDFVGEHPDLIPDLPWTLLEDSTTCANGVYIYGTPWVPGLPYWAFFGRQEALEARAELIPVGCDVLMTHGPPYGYGDLIPGGTPKQVEKYGNIDGMHVGDRSLVPAIERARPAITICGHIHEARGTYMLGERPVYNVASVDEQYVMHANPWTRLYEF
jgi:Icc-related predicted phosphoesterase